MGYVLWVDDMSDDVKWKDELSQRATEVGQALEQTGLTFLQARAKFFMEHKLDGAMMLLLGFAVGYLYRWFTS